MQSSPFLLQPGPLPAHSCSSRCLLLRCERPCSAQGREGDQPREQHASAAQPPHQRPSSAAAGQSKHHSVDQTTAPQVHGVPIGRRAATLTGTNKAAVPEVGAPRPHSSLQTALPVCCAAHTRCKPILCGKRAFNVTFFAREASSDILCR